MAELRDAVLEDANTLECVHRSMRQALLPEVLFHDPEFACGITTTRSLTGWTIHRIACKQARLNALGKRFYRKLVSDQQARYDSMGRQAISRTLEGERHANMLTQPVLYAEHT